MIDLSQELDGPIHYSVLAERLGVRPFTAYDMLRLLEEKGLVSSRYQVAKGKSGPGRAERLFFPLRQHNQELADRFGAISSSEGEWKQFILDRIRQGKAPEKEFADELLARIHPDGPEYIRYCLEVMMVLALRLRRHAGQREFITYLSDILPHDGEVSPAHLCLLGGFAFGFFAKEDRDREWSHALLKHVLQYQEIVRRLTPQECRHLADDLIAIFSPQPAGPK